MEKLLFFIVVLITNAIQAITGFAGTLLAMPLSIQLIGVEDAKVVLNFITFLTCLVIAIQNRNAVKWKVLGKILVFMLIGMIVGVWIFKLVQVNFLLYLYGIMIILIAISNLRGKKMDIPLKAWMSAGILILAGVIHGIFVSGGALLVIYAAIVLKSKGEFRATVASVWVVLNSFMIIEEMAEGIFQLDLAVFCVISCIPAFVGVWIGNRVYHSISRERFMHLTYLLLLLSGILCFI